MTTFNVAINNGADDCQYGSSFDSSGIRYTLGNVSGTSFSSGVRFNSVTIPQGATIDSAKITVTASGNESGTTCSVTIKGVADDNYNGFSDNAGDRPSDVSATTASTAWTNIGAWTSGTEYDTPDITDIVQEIVDRVGWSSGNSMAFVFRDNSSSSGAYRRPRSYDTYPSNATELTITYTTAAGPANLKTYNTNASANIKTINTNAIANVKSLNTNT